MPPAYSQTVPGLCSQKDSAIFFGNGIWTTRTGAFRGLQELKIAVGPTLSPEDLQKIEFGLAYNTTNGTVTDLLESYIQDISTDVTAFWRAIAGLIPMPASLQDVFLNLAASVDKTALLANQDLSIHVTAYKNKVLEGKKVVLVPHSQGNFFANQAYGNLSGSEQNSVGIVAVANPDGFVAGQTLPYAYTTLFEDFIWFYPGALPFNITNGGLIPSVSGHFFGESYLAIGSNSRTNILNDIVSVKAGLAQPVNTGGQGIITATLTWGPQPDVDLHAFEPNGAHVYYANGSGPSGFLDVDDVTSFGPEHYFVGCDTLEPGNYRIGVNYYHGSAPEVANILIQAGLQSRGFTIFLPTALGVSGDASPTPVGTINVTGDRQEGFQFNIQ